MIIGLIGDTECETVSRYCNYITNQTVVKHQDKIEKVDFYIFIVENGDFSSLKDRLRDALLVMKASGVDIVISNSLLYQGLLRAINRESHSRTDVVDASEACTYFWKQHGMDNFEKKLVNSVLDFEENYDYLVYSLFKNNRCDLMYGGVYENTFENPGIFINRRLNKTERFHAMYLDYIVIYIAAFYKAL